MNNMITFFSAFSFAIVGAIFGSFSGAQVWRLRAHQLREDKEGGEEVDERELKKLSPLIVKTSEDRSRCLSCGTQLHWYDLIPVVSWLSTAGECRYCHKKIGSFEILMEVGYAVFFAVSYLVFSDSLGSVLGMARLAVWLCAGVLMGILVAYDAKWFLLPEKLNIGFGVLGLLFAILTYAMTGFDPVALWSLGGALLIMSGIYLVLYLVSGGAWIGFGDIVLGIGLGCMLMTWDKAFLALFLANMLGLLAILPAYIRKQVSGKTHIPFGPFLISATVLVVLFGDQIMTLASRVLESFTGLLLNSFML